MKASGEEKPTRELKSKAPVAFPAAQHTGAGEWSPD